MIVGVTGGIGSGKSTIASYFATFKNVAIYIADDEAKKLMHTNQLKKQIINAFGEESYSNNQLNRKHLATIVFNNKSKLKTLNKIVHPAVNNHFKNFVHQNKDKDYIIYENAILFENNNDTICDVIICVTIPLNIRLERVMKRDNVSMVEVENRMKNQWKEDKKLLQSNYVIYNYTKATAKNEVNRIHKILTRIL